MKLEPHIKIYSGLNPSRAKLEWNNEDLYSVKNLEEDLGSGTKSSPDVFKDSSLDFSDYKIKKGDLVLGMGRGLASIVSGASSGKRLNSNFAKIILLDSSLDPWFLVYWFNESPEIAKQNVLSLGRALYTPSAVQKLEINPPPIDIQQEIGSLYRLQCRQSQLLDLEKEKWRVLTLEAIRRVSSK